jgi:hypothetical protein
VGTGVVGSASSTFYCQNTTSSILTATGAINAFWTSIKALLPASITINTPGGGQVYDDVSGLLLGTWSGAVGGPVAGTGAGAFGSASGGSVRWLTSSIVRRHALSGRTYLVPLVASAFNANGVLSPASVTTIQTAATVLAGAGGLKIWSRPTTLNPIGASGFISGATVLNKDAILRSRRD